MTNSLKLELGRGPGRASSPHNPTPQATTSQVCRSTCYHPRNQPGREELAWARCQPGVGMGPRPPVTCTLLGGVARVLHTC